MRTPAVQLAPHSWDFDNWPPHVYPHKENRARYIVRSHMDELIHFRAVRRVGRELVFDGVGYSKWLASKATNLDYEIAPNRDNASAA